MNDREDIAVEETIPRLEDVTQTTREERRERERVLLRRRLLLVATGMAVSLLTAVALIVSSRNAPSQELQALAFATGGAVLALISLGVLLPALSGILSGESAPYGHSSDRGGMLALDFAGLSLRLPIGSGRSTSGDDEPNPAEFTASDWRRSYEQASLARMSDNLRALGQRATWSLIAGVGFAAAGVALLFTSSIMLEQPVITELMAFIRHYAPRLSITIIVELVAFFFLRTYARTLTDIRYVQNEFTNVEMKLIALHASVDLKYTDVTKKALVALVNTERNHILEKGQTSLEMERERIEHEGFIAGAQAFAGVFKRDYEKNTD